MATMRICGNVLAIFAFHQICFGASAFQAQAPNIFLTSTVHKSCLKSINTDSEVIEATIIGKEELTKALEARIIAELEEREPTPVIDATVINTSKETKAQRIWENSSRVQVPGEALKTWTFKTSALKRIQVVMTTEGYPLDADIDVWQGPDGAPQRMRVYNEDGDMRPLSIILETKRGGSTIAIRNAATSEFPLTACVSATDKVDNGFSGTTLSNMGGTPITMQGGGFHAYPFDPIVESVQVLLMTDGRPMTARVELMQGPQSAKQIIELYTEDGLDRPFYAVIETPGNGYVVQVLNTASVGYPLTAWVEPYLIGGSCNDYVSEPMYEGNTISNYGYMP